MGCWRAGFVDADHHLPPHVRWASTTVLLIYSNNYSLVTAELLLPTSKVMGRG